jgi:hypothetical protein
LPIDFPPRFALELAKYVLVNAIAPGSFICKALPGFAPCRGVLM